MLLQEVGDSRYLRKERVQKVSYLRIVDMLREF